MVSSARWATCPAKQDTQIERDASPIGMDMPEFSLALELAPFVPEFIKRRLVQHPESLNAPLAERWPGAALVADVSGFTALAEQLAQEGAVGAERLTEILNAFFGRVVKCVESHGGDVARFAGDALLVIWPCRAESEIAQATRRAAACALDLQSRIAQWRAEEASGLSMKIAIGSGTLVALHLGGVCQRWEFLISGSAFQQAFAALRQTEAGQATASVQAWKFLQTDYQGAQLVGGIVALEDGPRDAHLATEPLVTVDDSMTEGLRSYVPAAVADRITAGQAGWLGELRTVTVLFISLPELNPATPLDRAQTLMTYLQRELYRYEGAVNKLNVDEKGAALLAAFGLPPLAHEDDARRGAAAALAMQRQLREHGIDGSIGVATGRVYCGAFGGERRREYTLLGDVVNRAARLMQAAVGDIFCDEATQQAAQKHVQFEALPHVMLKGKSTSLAVYRPVTPRDPAGTAAVELVGRHAELEQLSEELRYVLAQGEARTLIVEGEPGVGKSHLISAWLRRAVDENVAALQGQADALETTTLYYAWRHIFEALFQIDATTPGHEARRRIENRLQTFPEFTEWSPLLRAVLPADLPENDLTVHMTGRVRGENTRRLLAELLHAEARRQPLIVVLDDVHWLDSASWELAEITSRLPAPVLLVLGQRPASEPLSASWSRMVESDRCRRVVLSPLPDDEALRLACRRLGVPSLPSRIGDFILRRAEGNPLYTEEMAYALRDTGQLEIVNGKCRASDGLGELHTLDFPDTLHGVITSRLDRLAPPEQLTVKVASVIGRHFPYLTLHAVYPVEPDRPRLRDHLGAALRSQIVQVEIPEPDLSYLFRHALAHEAAYNLLLFHQRKTLHRAVAQWRESSDPEIAPQTYATLAHHWRNAGEPSRALNYLEKAGQHALDSGAYHEAIALFRRALELDESETLGTPAARRAAWERRLGDAHLGLGRLAESRRRLLMSLHLHDASPPESSLGLARKLLSHLVQQTPDLARSRTAAPRHAPNDAALSRDLEITRAYESLAEIYYLSNQKLALVQALVANLYYAKRAGPSPELARAYANNSISAGLAGLHALARRCARRAKQIGREVGDPATLAWVLEVTSLYALGVGEAPLVQADLEEAAAICRRLGDWRRWGENMATLAQGAYYAGDIPRGYTAWDNLRRAAAERGDELQQAWGLNGSAEGLLRRRESHAASRAVELLSDAHALYERNTDRISRLGAWGLLAWAYSELDDEASVLQSLRAGLQLAAEIGSPTGHYSLAGYSNLSRAALWLAEHGTTSDAAERGQLVVQAQRALNRYARIFPIGRPIALVWQGAGLWLQGRRRPALKRWRQAIAKAQSLPMPYEELLAHEALALRLPEDDPARSGHEAAVKKLSHQVGMFRQDG